MPTVLITGCSSGFGLETARYFLAHEWNVVATMRHPDPALFPSTDRVRMLSLDVTDPVSIRQAVEAAGPLDALVNNAGFGALNALEGMPMSAVRELFETNTLGSIAVTQAVLPQFRAQGSGVVVNVTSSVTLRAMPLLAVYTATKAAVNAFTECLALEMAPFNVRARLVLPGRAPDTAFAANAQARMTGDFAEPYALQLQALLEGFQQDAPVTVAPDVAEAVWRAVIDPGCPMRLPAGADAVEWARNG